MYTTKELSKKFKVSNFVIRYHTHKLGLNKRSKTFKFTEIEADNILTSIKETKAIEVVVPVIQKQIVKEVYYIYQSKMNYEQ
jgi:hypothetical protein